MRGDIAKQRESELISKQLDMIAGIVFEIDNFDILKKKVEVAG